MLTETTLEPLLASPIRVWLLQCCCITIHIPDYTDIFSFIRELCNNIYFLIPVILLKNEVFLFFSPALPRTYFYLWWMQSISPLIWVLLLLANSCVTLNCTRTSLEVMKLTYSSLNTHFSLFHSWAKNIFQLAQLDMRPGTMSRDYSCIMRTSNSFRSF